MSTLVIGCGICHRIIVEMSKAVISQDDIDSYSQVSCEIDGTAEIYALVDGIIAQWYIPAPDMQTIVSDAIVQARAFGNNLIIQFSAENVLLGFTTDQLNTTLTTLAGVMDALKAGALAIAIQRLNLVTPDGIVITRARITQYIGSIESFLANQ